ncbi:MAG: heme-binding domain-containing protein [Thermomicrobiales bacterium]
MRWRKKLGWVGGMLIALFLLLQAVPYGRAHENPGVVREPPWDSPRTRELAVRACFDCHSNESAWPWYSNVAPASWYVQRHVEEGREKLNFSEFGIGAQETSESDQVVRFGTMPPGYYTPLHPPRASATPSAYELVRPAATFGIRRRGAALPAEAPTITTQRKEPAKLTITDTAAPRPTPIAIGA